MARAYSGPPATLGALLKYGHGLRAICPNRDCMHHEALDVLALSLRFGETFPVPDVSPYLRCTKCQAKPCTVQVTTPDREARAYPDSTGR